MLFTILFGIMMFVLGLATMKNWRDREWRGLEGGVTPNYIFSGGKMYVSMLEEDLHRIFRYRTTDEQWLEGAEKEQRWNELRNVPSCSVNGKDE